MHRVETAAKGVNNGCNSIVGINEISQPYHYPILAMSVMAGLLLWLSDVGENTGSNEAQTLTGWALPNSFWFS